ncbi:MULTISPECIES: cyclic-di-AMP receptor [Peptoniphilus]|jgi:yaaQ|uniref:Cyclic-di-AMP receptor n=1 Tax=Peptoniphilus harei TaxID=54005 RepID=A0A2X1XZ36_9FIRM|nr:MULTISPECIES: cyclic-di-AMP receptor [Peptoniphilus]MBS6535120.1 cyclic-di-AMP receptor [Peptoniphilus harei]MDU1176279.1 cyclic-di-AMP receptor [Peptoniphilus harei]MDU2372950.1 cyclic-di-AMP receptor [Peptoniphilus harei]MDU3086617.1 cyclic-di-AMP receptor [Peptoniphilus harei]MDU5417685.1 cyclic-di-AMP receptor [Peptoniphilus harei]
MKMMIAIVQEKYTDGLIDRFLDEDIYVTRLSSTGGFFKSGNTTLLLGCKEDEIDRIYEIFKEETESEDVHMEEGDFKVSGATIFVVDLEESKRI